MAIIQRSITVLIFSLFTLQALVKAAPSEDFDAADRAEDYDEEEEVTSKLPNFLSKAQNFKVKIGDSVRLPCEVDDLGSYTLLWKREEGDILTAGRIQISKDSRLHLEENSLILTNINVADKGSYICQISSQDPHELVHTIDVLAPPRVRTVPETGILIAQKGEPVDLKCETTGNPQPTVIWTREGGKKFPDGQKTMMGQSITFMKSNRHHAGVYECTAENGEGNPAKANISLHIIYSPEVEVELNSVSTAEGYNTELTCTVHGEPKPQVMWIKNGAAVENNDRYSQSNVGSRHVLSIENVHLEDFANYTCKAVNRHGADQKVIEVTGLATPAVLKRNKPLANGVELEWVTTSHIPVTEYRLRFHRHSDSGFEELLIKPSEQDTAGMLYKHVHQLHNLESGTEYHLTIESKNSFGWSRPLRTTFTTSPAVGTGAHAHKNSPTVGTESAIQEAGRASNNGGYRTLTSAIAPLVLTIAVAFLIR